MTLDNLKIGKCGRVIQIDKNAKLYRRFLDIGIIEGTKLECVLESPAKDPKAYFIRGTVIALRNEDARGIKIIEEVIKDNGT